MATLKLKARPTPVGDARQRTPVRGAGSAGRNRPTLARADAERAERKAFAGERQRPLRPSQAPDGSRKQPQMPPAPPSTSGPQRAGPARSDSPGSLRLSKRMSELGIASRREADEWIEKGYVRVDGRIVSELGSRVGPDQHVTVDARARQLQAKKVTILLNKPIGFVSAQAEDGHQPAALLITPQNQWRQDRSAIRFLREHLLGLAPAGRLDIDSTGLLVLTQDGRVARQLIGDDSVIEKEYLVRVEPAAAGRRLDDAGLSLLRHGLELDGEPLREAAVEWINDDQLRFILRQGKKRQIRRMCEAVGLTVLGLKRVRIGRVALGDLPAGRWRYLRIDEAFA